ncbi:MAG: hypothetical protein QG670_1153 [Thermoproteota archaeon]|nr:hypothetical protein [Thermoproteota archaeon]
MNVRLTLMLLLSITGFLAIVYGIFGIFRLIETFYAYIMQGVNIVDLIGYNIDFIFLIIIAIGSGSAQLIVAWLFMRTREKKIEAVQSISSEQLSESNPS